MTDGAFRMFAETLLDGGIRPCRSFPARKSLAYANGPTSALNP